MAYCQPNDVREVLTPEGGEGGAPDTTTAASLSDEELQGAISDAQAEVDASLASAPTFYTVPFADGQVPQLVFEVTRDIAAYLATLIYRKGKSVENTHPVYLRWQRATGILANLGSGKLVPPGITTNESYQGAVINTVPDEWTWYPDVGFGAGQQVPGG